MGRRFAAAALVLSLLGLGLGAATSSAGSSPPSTGPFAAFLACLKDHGAPTLGHPGNKGQAGENGSDQARKDDHRGNDKGMPPPGGKQGSGRHGHGGWPGGLSDADRAALKAAFAACRDLLPQPTHTAPMPTAAPPGDHSGHRFTLPTRAQLQAFTACMAGKGFSVGKPGSGTRPDFRDPTVRTAFKNALQACAPQLKPAPNP